VTLSTAFLDEVRARTTLSMLIGQTVTLKKSGREHSGLCPFHTEKSGSFTVNDDKGFYHCFGCSAHGDAVRWLTEQAGMTFIDAVRQLADAAGLDMPPRELSAEAIVREDLRTRLFAVLGDAARWYSVQLEQAGAAREYLADRGIDDAAIAAFDIGWAPGGRASVRSGVTAKEDDLIAAGLLRRSDDGIRDFLWNRIVFPVRDQRGQVCGFAARALGDQKPKYVNSPDGPMFDKGRLLFNLDRAAGVARSSRALIIVEGQVDAVQLDQSGFAAVAPMGTAVTAAQLGRAWRVANAPVLLFDGDGPGRAAAVRACEAAMPFIGPGATLKIALCPDGTDPDSLVRAHGPDAITACVADAVPLDQFLFDAVMKTAA
jgi:DNA primase